MLREGVFGSLEPAGKELDHKEVQVHGRADRLRADRGESGRAGGRGHLANGLLQADVLRLEKVYGMAGVGELRRIEQLEYESRKLRHLVGYLQSSWG